MKNLCGIIAEDQVLYAKEGRSGRVGKNLWIFCFRESIVIWRINGKNGDIGLPY